MTESRLLRWTIAGASREFNIDPKTLVKLLAAASIAPGEDGGYSTAQICQVVFGSIDAEKLRLTREQADKYALENAETRRNLISVEDAIAISSKFLFAIRQKILASSMSDEEKQRTLLEIQALRDADFTKMPSDDVEEEAK